MDLAADATGWRGTTRLPRGQGLLQGPRMGSGGAEDRPPAGRYLDGVEVVGGRRIPGDSDSVQVGQFAALGAVGVEVIADLQRPLMPAIRAVAEVSLSAACRYANDRQPRCGCCSCRHGSGRRHVRRSEAALAVRPDRRKDLNRCRRALRSGRCQVRKGPDVR
jgi:hypothetical protein